MTCRARSRATSAGSKDAANGPSRVCGSVKPVNQYARRTAGAATTITHAHSPTAPSPLRRWMFATGVTDPATPIRTREGSEGMQRARRERLVSPSPAVRAGPTTLIYSVRFITSPHTAQVARSCGPRCRAGESCAGHPRTSSHPRPRRGLPYVNDSQQDRALFQRWISHNNADCFTASRSAWHPAPAEMAPAEMRASPSTCGPPEMTFLTRFPSFIYVSRRLRFVPEGGALVEVTCRSIQGRFLLKPSPMLNELVVGVLGRAQELYPVEICGLVFTSNHYHMLLRVPDAERMSRFMGYVNTNIAKEAGKLAQWREKFWSRRYQHIVVTEEEPAQVARMKYLLSHGAKEGLVRRPQDWPGVHGIPRPARRRAAARLLVRPYQGVRRWAEERGASPGWITPQSTPSTSLPCPAGLIFRRSRSESVW